MAYCTETLCDLAARAAALLVALVVLSLAPPFACMARVAAATTHPEEMKVIPPSRARGTFARAHVGEARRAEPFRLFPPDAYPEIERQKRELQHESRSCFVFREDGGVEVTVTPRRAQALVFAVAGLTPEGPAWGEYASVVVRAGTNDHADETLFEEDYHVRPARRAQWQAARVELNRYAGRQITLRFRVGLPGPETSCLLAEPRLEGGPPDGRPNVILYMIETLRRDHLSAYGYSRPTSPFLAELAEESIVFTGAHSQSSWTKPSVASYLTGLYPSEHGAFTGLDRLGDSFVLLPEILRANGYSTGSFCASPVVSSPSFNYAQGFDVSINERIKEGRRVMRDALRWLARERPDPFFMWVFTYDPHSPYDAPHYYKERFTGDYEGPLTEAEPFSPPGFRDAICNRGHFRREDVDYIKARYDSEIRYADAVLEDFVRELQRRHLWEDTLLVVCSDHGEEFYEHGDWDHARDLYGEKLRVPLIIKLPGQKHGGRRVHGLASSVDLLPTLLARLGLSPDQSLPGIDLLRGGLQTGTTGRRQHFAEYRQPHYCEHDGRMLTEIVGLHYSVITPRYQYIWQQHRVPVGLVEVAAADQSLWTLNGAGEIWFHHGACAACPVGRRCERVPGRLAFISVGPGATTWALDEEGGLFVRTGVHPGNRAGESWRSMEGRCLSVSVAGRRVWAVDASGRLKVRQGVTAQDPVGSHWQTVRNSCRWVSAAGDAVWVVAQDGTALVRAGPAANWREVPGRLSRVEVAPGGVAWALDADGNVLVRTGVSREKPAGEQWQRLEGRIVSLSATGRCVWAVDAQGRLLVRTGVSPENPAGHGWHRVGRSTEPSESLYDLTADPMAQHDVAAQHPETVTELGEFVRDRYLRTGVTIAVNGTGSRRVVRGTVESSVPITAAEGIRTEQEDTIRIAENGRLVEFALSVGSDDDVLHLQAGPADAALNIRFEGDQVGPVYLGPARESCPEPVVQLGRGRGRADVQFGYGVSYATGSEGGIFIWRRLPPGRPETVPVRPEEQTIQQLRDLGYL